MASEEDWYRITEPSQLAEHLIANAEERRLRLLACAVLRYAPFDEDGKSIWDLASDFTWVRDNQFAGRSFGLHAAICAVEKAADGECDPLEREEATRVCHLAEYRAEGELYAASGASGSHSITSGVELRFDLASLLHSVSTPDSIEFARANYHWWLKPDAKAWRHSKNPMLRKTVCDLIRDIFPPGRFSSWDRFLYGGDACFLAHEIYQQRQFHRMAELGTLLEQNGYPGERVIRHCFEQPVHSRGCWVLDGLAAQFRHAERF